MTILIVILVLWIIWLTNPTFDGFICCLNLTFMSVSILSVVAPEGVISGKGRLFWFLIFLLTLVAQYYIYTEGLMLEGGPRQPR